MYASVSALQRISHCPECNPPKAHSCNLYLSAHLKSAQINKEVQKEASLLFDLVLSPDKFNGLCQKGTEYQMLRGGLFSLTTHEISHKRREVEKKKKEGRSNLVAKIPFTRNEYYSKEYVAGKQQCNNTCISFECILVKKKEEIEELRKILTDDTS